jgi:RNA polymerase sigma factor (sigma-70 family)
MSIPESSAKVRGPERRERVAAALLAARSGDRHALDDLVRELTPMLWHVARAQGLDREDSVDVVQGTWLALVTSIENIRDPSALVGWLVTTTRRQAWRVHAAHKAEQPAATEEFDDQPDPEAAVDDRVLADEQRTRLWTLISTLPPLCQQLVRIVAFADRPDYDAISKALDMPRGSIGPTRGRCLAKLRQLLGVDKEGGWQWQR